MKTFILVLCLLSVPAFANDAVKHQCAIVDSSGNIVNLINADPNPPDNDVSPIPGDTLVIVDGTGDQIGGTIIGGVYTPPSD